MRIKKKDIFQYFLSNIWIGVILILLPLFFIDLFLDDADTTQPVEIVLDKTFEDIDEIYIDNTFGKSIILHVPKRSRIIVQKKEYMENNTYMIKINIINKGE